MFHAKAPRRQDLLVALLLAASITPVCRAERPAVLADGEQLPSTDLVAYDSEPSPRSATLRISGTSRETSGLIRWGEPAPTLPRASLVLADGSRLLSNRTWSPAGLIRVDEEQVKLRRGGGWFTVDRGSVRWVMIDGAAAGLDLGSSGEGEALADDEVWLGSGDRLTGRVVGLTNKELRLEVGDETLATPLDRVTAIRFSGVADPEANATCLVGLADGSLVRANRLRVAGERYELDLLGSELAGEAGDLALVQPLGEPVQYLSDLEPADYQHTPYLDLAWPYTRDRGLRGNPLAGGAARRAKGLAMHSAARLIYRHDGGPARLQADLAVGDPPEGSEAIGSVVFRVYLVLEGEFRQAYESPTLRTGDAPTPIDLDVTGAAAIALVVDYADNGDAGDEALWLDARLVESE